MTSVEYTIMKASKRKLDVLTRNLDVLVERCSEFNIGYQAGSGAEKYFTPRELRNEGHKTVPETISIPA
jgi:hypothetical protein